MVRCDELRETLVNSWLLNLQNIRSGPVGTASCHGRVGSGRRTVLGEGGKENRGGRIEGQRGCRDEKCIGSEGAEGGQDRGMKRKEGEGRGQTSPVTGSGLPSFRFL